MKKVFSLLAAGLLAFSLGACASYPNQQMSDDSSYAQSVLEENGYSITDVNEDGTTMTLKVVNDLGGANIKILAAENESSAALLYEQEKAVLNDNNYNCMNTEEKDADYLISTFANSYADEGAVLVLDKKDKVVVEAQDVAMQALASVQSLAEEIASQN